MPKNPFEYEDLQEGSGTSNSDGEETTIDEAVIRNRVAQAALSWNGTAEGSAAHEKIVAEFNQIGAWPISTASAWCAAFATVAAYEGGIGDIVPNFPTCTAQIAWFQQNGGWVGGNTYHPKIGDYCYYDWDRENGNGADHVGIVVAVGEKGFSVCEGNKLGKNGNPDAVGVREVAYGSASVYGFGIPAYNKETVNTIQASYEPVEYTPPSVSTWNEEMDGETNWLRRYRLEVGMDGQKGGFVIGEYDGPNKPPLRIQFNVEKVDMETPNNSMIKVWNLGTKHRELLSTPGCYVKLFAGYGHRLPEITEGMVAKAVDSFDGGNLVTDIEIIDIRKNIRDTYVAFSEKGDVTGKYIIEKVVVAMGQPMSMLRFEEGLNWKTYSGFSYCGTALGCIERVCHENGYLATILNGIIDIHQAGHMTQARPVILSAETGLIGNPKKLIETEDGVYYLRGWQVEFMLTGGIDLGSPVRLESPFVYAGSGIFDVIQLNITGDSMVGDWKCTAKLQDPYFTRTQLFNPKDWGIGTYTDTGSGFARETG